MNGFRWTLATWAVLATGAALMAPAQAQDTPSDLVRRAVHVCDACHGEQGLAKDPGNPSLAGQMPQYLQRQLKDFRAQARSEANLRAYMWGVSALLDDAAIAGLAEYYATQPARPGVAGPARLVAAGRTIFQGGLPKRGVRACAECHGDMAEGEAGFPRLAGQKASYVLGQLRQFKSTPLRKHGVLMKDELRALGDADMRALAAYVQSL